MKNFGLCFDKVVGGKLEFGVMLYKHLKGVHFSFCTSLA